MEKENIIDMYEKDLDELNHILTTLTRPNLKRQLEEYKKTIVHSIDAQRKKLEKEKEHIPTNVYKDEMVYESISKYAFDSGDEFVK
jgi:hypothetical protein